VANGIGLPILHTRPWTHARVEFVSDRAEFALHRRNTSHRVQWKQATFNQNAITTYPSIMRQKLP